MLVQEEAPRAPWAWIEIARKAAWSAAWTIAWTVASSTSWTSTWTSTWIPARTVTWSAAGIQPDSDWAFSQ